MNMIKTKPSSALFLFLVLCFSAVVVHADTGTQLLFVANSNLFGNNYLPSIDNQPVVEQSRQINGKPRFSSDKVFLEVLVGIVGNLQLGGCLASLLVSGDSESFFPATAVVGYSSGSLFGSALGVYLIGNSGNVRGNFGKALLGSFLGEIASLGVTMLSRFNIAVYCLSTVILPTIGAVILFNSSLRYRDLPAGNGLVNLNNGKLQLGIPDMQIRPIAGYGKNMKTEFQFKVNLMSVVL